MSGVASSPQAGGQPLDLTPTAVEENDANGHDVPPANNVSAAPMDPPRQSGQTPATRNSPEHGKNPSKQQKTAKKTCKERIKEKLRPILSKFIPPLRSYPWTPQNCYERIFVEGTFVNKFAKAFLTWLTCQVVGLVLFFLCSIKYTTDPRRIAVYTGMITEAVTVFVFLFERVKIVFLVGVPSLITSKFRTVIVLVIVTWALQGPALNATNNVRASVEGVACVQVKVRTLADQIRNNANDKLQQVPLAEAQEMIDRVMTPFKKVKAVLRKIDDSVSKMLEWQKTVMAKMTSVFESCSEYSRVPYNTCVNKMDDLYYQCLDKTFDVICEPIKLLKRQCFVSRFLVSLCDWPANYKKNLQEGVLPYVKNALHSAVDLTKNTTFYKLAAKGKDLAVGSKTAYDTLNLTFQHGFAVEQKMNLQVDEFKTKLRSEIAVFEHLLSVIARVADFAIYPIMLMPFITAVIYVVKFNRVDKADNYFLTRELDDIDNNRKKIRESSIYPLSKDEQKTFIKAYTWRISSKEKLRLALKIAMTVIGILIPLMFVVVDILTYTILDTGYQFFQSNLTQIIKPNVYQLKVSGSGFLNALLSNILEVFQPLNKFTDKKDNLWRGCFEEPAPPHYKTFRAMLGLFILAVITCFVEVYVKRIRHVIAGNYFKTRRRPRALFLYNQILESRKNVLSETIKLAAKKMSRLMPGNQGNDVKDKPPEDEATHVQFKTNQCVRCARTDLKLTANSNTRICVNCNTLYCVDCFSVSRKCYDCQWPIQKIAEEAEFYVDSSCSESE